jgi:hypothetical protein
MNVENILLFRKCAENDNFYGMGEYLRSKVAQKVSLSRRSLVWRDEKERIGEEF